MKDLKINKLLPDIIDEVGASDYNLTKEYKKNGYLQPKKAVMLISYLLSQKVDDTLDEIKLGIADPLALLCVESRVTASGGQKNKALIQQCLLHMRDTFKYSKNLLKAAYTTSQPTITEWHSVGPLDHASPGTADGSLHLGWCLTHYKRKGGKPYVLEKNFYDEYRNVNLKNLTFGSLPQNLCGFVRMPYSIPEQAHPGCTYREFFFFVGSNKNYTATAGNEPPYHPDQDKHLIMSAWLDNNNAVSFQHFLYSDKDKDIPIADIAAEDGTLVYSKVRYEYEILRILFYLSSGNPDLRAFRNDIQYKSADSKKLTRASKNLSPSDIILVGYGYKKTNLRHAKIWYQPGYYAIRWIGPGRKIPQHTYIPGSIHEPKK